MKRATEQLIAKSLKQWSLLRGRRERIEAERDQQLAPIRARFEQQCAPIQASAEKKLSSIAQEMELLELEISNVVLKEIELNGQIDFTHDDTATAVVKVVTRTERELDSKAFFESVPPSKRSTAFWSCLKTMIGNAEKFLGADRLNALAQSKTTHRVSIVAKQS